MTTTAQFPFLLEVYDNTMGVGKPFIREEYADYKVALARFFELRSWYGEGYALFNGMA